MPAPESTSPAGEPAAPPIAAAVPGGASPAARFALAIPLPALALAVLLNVLWGANVPAVKVGLLAFPPLWSGFWRFLLGSICIAAWARYKGIQLRPPRAEWGGLALLGVVFTVQIALMNIGIRHTTGAMAAILISTNPLWAALSAHWLVPGDRLSRERAAGLAVAFAGICAIFLRDGWAVFHQASTLGNGICLASASLLGGRLVFTSRLVRKMETTRVVVWQMLLSLPCFALGGWLTEQIDWAQLGWYPLAGIAYQGIVVAGFNFMGMAYLLRLYNPSVVVGFNFVSPVCGVLLSLWLLGETVTWHVLAGMAAVGLGLVLISRR